MERRNTDKTGAVLLGVTAALFASGNAVGEEVNMYDGEWRYGVTIYDWFPNIYQTLNLPRVGSPTATFPTTRPQASRYRTCA